MSAKVLGFNLEVVRSACVMGHSVVRQYILRQLVAPGSASKTLIVPKFQKSVLVWMTFIVYRSGF
eukprot:6437209-Amphidinium_carterae.1